MWDTRKRGLQGGRDYGRFATIKEGGGRYGREDAYRRCNILFLHF